MCINTLMCQPNWLWGIHHCIRRFGLFNQCVPWTCFPICWHLYELFVEKIRAFLLQEFQTIALDSMLLALSTAIFQGINHYTLNSFRILSEMVLRPLQLLVHNQLSAADDNVRIDILSSILSNLWILEKEVRLNKRKPSRLSRLWAYAFFEGKNAVNCQY